MEDIRNHILAYDPFLFAPGGRQTTDPLEAIGTDYDTCRTYCGDSSNSFNWSAFSPQFTGWLLPFLALLAQLPYESDGTWHDFMSLMLTTGSPLLAMYSLTLTILNSRYLKQCLDEAFPGESVRLGALKKNILRILKISQQEPFQLENLDAYPNEAEGGRLKDVERHWWHEAQIAVANKERRFTASLAAQAVSVIIAFSFTWVDAFGSEHIGTTVTAFGLATALCWSWVAIIVLGWFFAGVSISNHPISEAIKQANRLQRNAKPRLAPFIAPEELGYFSLSRRIAGDVERAGPLYNYAKAFVWTYNVDHLLTTLHAHILRQQGTNALSPAPSAGAASITFPEPIPLLIFPHPTSAGAPTIAASSHLSLPEVGPEGENKSSYRYFHSEYLEKVGWKRSVHQRMFWSAISAIVLNTSTVGAAFWLDFLTPSIGLGCRSGGILVYWMTSYIVWVLMVSSAWISNHWSVRAAAQHIKKDRSPGNLYLLGAVAVILRLVGKGLAILNSIWIIMHCLFEFTGFYNRCFCLTNRGTSPWLWLDDATIRSLNNTQETWFGLAVLTGVMCMGYIAFMGLWTRANLQ